MGSNEHIGGSRGALKKIGISVWALMSILEVWAPMRFLEVQVTHHVVVEITLVILKP